MRQAGADMADLKEATSAAARTVAVASIARAPHRTGRLAGSVKGNKAMNRATVGSRLVYGGPIHWGWPGHNIAPQPFIADAAAATEPVWVAAYMAEIDKILGKVHGV
jgi:hypothetical protein